MDAELLDAVRELSLQSPAMGVKKLVAAIKGRDFQCGTKEVRAALALLKAEAPAPVLPAVSPVSPAVSPSASPEKPDMQGPATVKQAKQALGAYIKHVNAHPDALRSHYTDASGAVMKEAALAKTKTALRALCETWKGLKDSAPSARKLRVMQQIKSQYHEPHLNFQWSCDPTRGLTGCSPRQPCTNLEFAVAAPPEARWYTDGSCYTLFERSVGSSAGSSEVELVRYDAATGSKYVMEGVAEACRLYGVYTTIAKELRMNAQGDLMCDSLNSRYGSAGIDAFNSSFTPISEVVRQAKHKQSAAAAAQARARAREERTAAARARVAARTPSEQRLADADVEWVGSGCPPEFVVKTLNRWVGDGEVIRRCLARLAAIMMDERHVEASGRRLVSCSGATTRNASRCLISSPAAPAQANG
jgi:hypothetical protein